jgi:imidazolonepropionase-like amidohydrolase
MFPFRHVWLVAAVLHFALAVPSGVRAVSASQDQPVALVNARIFPVSSEPIERGTLVMQGDRITAVGSDVSLPPNVRIIDAAGRWVTPGFFAGPSPLGIAEGARNEPQWTDNVVTDPTGIASTAHSWDALFPGSARWAEAREEGVTSALTVTFVELPVTGQAALVRTAGNTRGSLIRRAPAAMLFNVNARTSTVKSRVDMWRLLRQLFAAAYDHSPAPAKNGFEPPEFSRDRLGALQPLLHGGVLAIFAVDRADEIRAVIDLCRRYGIRAAILGGNEAWVVASDLAVAHIPVMLSVHHAVPYDATIHLSGFDNAAKLRRAGVTVTFVPQTSPFDLGADAYNVRNIRIEAGIAVAYGMTWADALRGLTLSAAQVFGVDRELGSLEPGKIADVVVWDGDPLEPETLAERVFIDGRDVKTPSRQDLLTSKYLHPSVSGNR